MHNPEGLFQNTLVHMNWPQLQSLVDQNAVVLIPIGVIEEHGPHLCLGTDIYTAHLHCLSIQEKLEAGGIAVAIAPPFYWGVCQSTGGFLGSFRVRKETARALMVDLLASLAGFGFKNIFGINAHGDIEQNIVMVEAFKEASETLPIQARYVFPQQLLPHYHLAGDEAYLCPVPPQSIPVSTAPVPDVHAGDIETATMHAFYPALVDVSRARSLPPVSIPGDQIMTWLFGGHTQELSPNGYAGAPASFESVNVQTNLEDIASRVSRAILERLATKS